MINQIFELFGNALAGTWRGEGFARFSTIADTAYRETCIFKTDEHKPAIHFEQQTWYENDRPENGDMVFWDTGFLLVKDEKLLLVSAQAGGRLETYALMENSAGRFVFNSVTISNDPKTIRSQRILELKGNELNYELNMSTHQAAAFQNHLKCRLTRVI